MIEETTGPASESEVQMKNRTNVIVRILVPVFCVSLLLCGCSTSKFGRDHAFDPDHIVFRAGALSDIHQNLSNVDNNSLKMVAALKQLEEMSGGKLDAVMAAGDLTDSATKDEVGQFRNNYLRCFDPADVTLVYCMGNHDAKNETYETLKTYPEMFGPEFFLTDQEDSVINEGNRHCIVNGIHIITVMPENYAVYGEVVMGERTLKWLDGVLSKITAEEPGKPVFVLTHAMPYDTCYGSDLKLGDTKNKLGWYSKDLLDVLCKYNQVITLSGHLHFPLNDERSIMQTDFTALGCGSVRFMAIENGNFEDMRSATVMKDCASFSQGLYIEVDIYGNTRIARMDFYNGGTIKEDWIIPAPKADGSHLTVYGKDRANNPAPEFGKGGSVKKNQDGTITVEFAAATDDDLIHDYSVFICDKAGNQLKRFNILADFYHYTDPKDMKDSYTLNIGEFDPAAVTIRVVARDSWGHECEEYIVP